MLILGSSSSARRALLERLGLPFTVDAPDLDEAAIAADCDTPISVAQTLARAKAEAVARRHPDAIVIGSDQLACLGQRRFGKPGTRNGALAQLRELRGREHQLLTAVAVVCGKRVVEFVDTTRLTMRALSDAEITRYVEADAPYECAGSYRFEGLGICLFDRVDSHDQTAILGLPLLRLCAELRAFGVQVP
ncbi:MAG: septum formation protein Maf [Planctomycetes bacterium]|nr:septum formation protein Maf [Planctomycetota bacterium]